MVAAIIFLAAMLAFATRHWIIGIVCLLVAFLAMVA